MAKRNKRHKLKHISKQRNPARQSIIKQTKSSDKQFKNQIIIEFVKQIPFWWQQSKDLLNKIIEWIFSHY